MSRTAYVNGQYVPHAAAQVHVEDRGYQFADAVYEVVAVFAGKLIDNAGHMIRLKRSLAELRMDMPMTDAAFEHVMHEVLRRNRVTSGIIYIQISRGVARRDHAFPAPETPLSVVMTARRMRPFDLRREPKGASVLTIPDIRWERCDIKSVSLLPNVLGKQAARDAGAYEAWQVDADGFVTEGTSTNAWIVTMDGELVTRPVSHSILNGITRTTLLDLAKREGLTYVERPFTVEEAKRAREAFLTSTTSFVQPITRIDDAVIGNGEPGSVSLTLRGLYMRHMEELKASA